MVDSRTVSQVGSLHVLAQDLTDFLLEFWDNRRGEWLPEWTYTNQLPPVVRFLVGVGEQRNDPSMPQAFQVQTVALSAAPVPADLQGRPQGPLPVRGGTNAPPPASPPAGNPVP